MAEPQPLRLDRVPLLRLKDAMEFAGSGNRLANAIGCQRESLYRMSKNGYLPLTRAYILLDISSDVPHEWAPIDSSQAAHISPYVTKATGA